MYVRKTPKKHWIQAKVLLFICVIRNWNLTRMLRKKQLSKMETNNSNAENNHWVRWFLFLFYYYLFIVFFLFLFCVRVSLAISVLSTLIYFSFHWCRFAAIVYFSVWQQLVDGYCYCNIFFSLSRLFWYLHWTQFFRMVIFHCLYQLKQEKSLILL